MRQFLVIAIIVGCMSIPARAQMGSNLSSPPSDFSQNSDRQAQDGQGNRNGNNDNDNGNGYGSGNVGGCGDSPENPTIILAGLAMAGFGVEQWRRKRSSFAEMKLRPSNAK